MARVQRGRDLSHPGGCATRQLHAGLPIKDLNDEPRIAVTFYEDALGRKTPMDDLLTVGIADDFRDLAEDVEALINRQGVAFVSQEVVQRKGIWIAPEEQDRTVFALRRRLGLQDTCVVETFQKECEYGPVLFFRRDPD